MKIGRDKSPDTSRIRTHDLLTTSRPIYHCATTAVGAGHHEKSPNKESPKSPLNFRPNLTTLSKAMFSMPFACGGLSGTLSPIFKFRTYLVRTFLMVPRGSALRSCFFRPVASILNRVRLLFRLSWRRSWPARPWTTSCPAATAWAKWPRLTMTSTLWRDFCKKRRRIWSWPPRSDRSVSGSDPGNLCR